MELLRSSYEERGVYGMPMISARELTMSCIVSTIDTSYSSPGYTSQDIDVVV
jgi:hypothetical protein